MHKCLNGCKNYYKLSWDNCKLYVHYRKSFEVKNKIQILLSLQTKWDDFKHFRTSSEMLRFLNTMCDEIFKTFATLYHNFPIPYHDLSMNLMIF
jgi:hypothetical protein